MSNQTSSLRSRLLLSVKRMLGQQNQQPISRYVWMDEMYSNAPTSELIAMQKGWMRNSPKEFAAFGIYVL